MPTYVYEVITDSGEPGERFEAVQQMSDKPLTEHPETGVPVRRVILAARIAGKHSPMKTDRALADDKKLDRMGFTKYVKSDSGGYEKAAGSGPDLLKK
ncbi:MAG: FmdB family transcriptional regulator [Planctomycetes bacterium]|nr:FmdB family transcriptional regulator [Planctomycetota bacterium]MBL7044241.1 FmdB family transcriptional regulator [Pirellulaceae bacterium]